ncbi:hypothetical protein [Psychrobacter sp. AOP31-A1-22]|uniref:hypothetical protein n=1 Tax=Psychrobacter sp. AOP31-A1-22 TaxID=3457696 RepID=UPI00403738FD
MNVSTHDVMSDMAQAAIAADVLKPTYYEDTVEAVLSGIYGVTPAGDASDNITVISCINDDYDLTFVSIYNKDGEAWVLYRSRTV